jgi:hypothetical protein
MEDYYLNGLLFHIYLIRLKNYNINLSIETKHNLTNAELLKF